MMMMMMTMMLMMTMSMMSRTTTTTTTRTMKLRTEDGDATLSGVEPSVVGRRHGEDGLVVSLCADQTFTRRYHRTRVDYLHCERRTW